MPSQGLYYSTVFDYTGPTLIESVNQRKATMNACKSCLKILLILVCCGGTGLLTKAANITNELQTTAHQRVHPVLIGKEHNALVYVVMESPKGGERVTSLTFNLEGTDELNDIESLQLFYSGKRRVEELDQIRGGGRFDGDRDGLLKVFTNAQFGETTKPRARITFRGEQVLQSGTNIFWLSCKLNPTANLTHRVDALCVSAETSVGKTAPQDRSPGIRTRIGVALRNYNDDGVHTTRIPALTSTPQGTLLCVYDLRRRKRRDLQEDIDIGLSRSTDGGQTWEPVRVIMDMGEYGGLPQAENGCSDPGIVVDRETGEIFCAAVWMWGKPGKHQWRGDGSEPGFEIGKSAQFLMVRSQDDGKTWSKPENMTRKLKQPEWILIAPAPQGGFTLRDGTLVMPGQGRDEQDRQFSTLIVSKDHGATWKVGSAAASGNSECQAVQLDDGSIMLNARSSRPTKFRSVYVTGDLGRTWQQHPTHRKDLIEPNCNGSLLRFDYQQDGRPKHVLLFANPHTQKGRDHHTIQVSFDEGLTWPAKYHILLDEGRGNGYPCMTRIDDRHIGIVYEGSQAHVVFEKLSLEELLQSRK